MMQMTAADADHETGKQRSTPGITFGPGGLRAPPVVAGASAAGTPLESL